MLALCTIVAFTYGSGNELLAGATSCPMHGTLSVVFGFLHTPVRLFQPSECDDAIRSAAVSINRR